jgi:hypothetical protein
MSLESPNSDFFFCIDNALTFAKNTILGEQIWGEINLAKFPLFINQTDPYQNHCCPSIKAKPPRLELYIESVFSGRYWSVFLGIYHTDTEGNLGRYILA